MDWLLKCIVLWLSLDVIIITTGWYAVTTIEPRYPDWWNKNVAAYSPENS
jgi:hypothetical protein